MTENEALSGAGSAPAMAPVEPVQDDAKEREIAVILAELQQIKQERTGLEQQIAVLDERTSVLYGQFQELSGTKITEPTIKRDKRKDFNPIRNLKISANRAYGWAIKFNKLSVEVAKQKAIDAIFKAAKEFRSHPDVEPWLNTSVLPEVLANYVEVELPKTKKRRKKVQQTN